jgi:hypothetical protein
VSAAISYYELRGKNVLGEVFPALVIGAAAGPTQPWSFPVHEMARKHYISESVKK